MTGVPVSYEVLWSSALAFVPIAFAGALLVWGLRLRPASRHALWTVILASLMVPPVVHALDLPRLTVADSQAVPDDIAHRRAQAFTEPEAGESVPRAGFSSAAPVRLGGQRQEPASGEVPSLGGSGALELPAPVPVIAMDGMGGTLSPVMPSRVWMQRKTPTVDGTAPPNQERASEQTHGIAGADSASESRDLVSAGDGRSWRRALLVGVDWVRSVPMLPREVWLGGVLLFGGAFLVQVLRLSRMTRRGRPTDPGTSRLIRDLSGQMGLRRVPEAVFVDARVSPMVTCGICAKIVLPASLWEELDGEARRGVLVHELAHLRRRDHVLCWFESLLGVLYWWHPVVWWIRRRLHEDADLCCDAWVVSVLPGHRRAYAEALVTTRAFIADGRARAVGGGLGMASPRARRFTRRLSMIMTQKLSPRIGLAGLGLAGCLMMGGAALAPALACPPEGEEEPAALIRLLDQGQDQVAGRAQIAVSERAEAPALLSIVSQPEARTDRVEERIARLEAQLERLMAMMEQREARARAAIVPPPPQVADRPIVAERLVPPGRTMERAYHLPEGKMNALWELMARPDVPVFVSREGDAIVVHGTPEQQRIFAAFVAMIHPEHGDAGGMRAPQDPLEFMDPELERALRGREERVKQRVREFEPRLAELEAMHAQLEVEAHMHEMRLDDLLEQADRLFDQSERMEEMGEELQERAEEMEGRQGRVFLERSRELRRQAEELRARAEQMEREADAVEDRLDEIVDRMEDIEDEIEDLHEHAAALQGDDVIDFDQDDWDEDDWDEDECEGIEQGDDSEGSDDDHEDDEADAI